MPDPNGLRTVVAIAVVQRDDQFLVGQRSAESTLAGYWEFPGGKVEPQETPDQAAVRECVEETGVEIRVVAPILTQPFQYEFGELELHFFDGRPVNENIVSPPSPPFVWVARDQLAHLKFPPANDRLLERLVRAN